MTARAAAVFDLLAAIRRQARAWIVVESLALLVLTLVAAGWAAYGFDRLVEPPAWVRVGLVVGTTVALGWLAVVRLVLRLARPLSDESLALAVERAHPGVGDALSTVVSCGRRGVDAAAPIDDELLARTAAEAEAAVAAVRPTSLFRIRGLVGLAAVAGVALAATAAALAARPAEAGVWLRRVLLLSDEAWPRRVALAAEGFESGRRVVARGADVDVIVRATAQGRLPEVMELRTRGRGGWRSDRMGTRGAADDHGQTFGHVLPAVVEDLELAVRGGDARLAGLRIVVADPPAIDRLAITCTPPGYLGAEPRSLAVSRLVPVPTGSRIDIVLTATKPFASADVRVRPAATDAAPTPVVWASVPDSDGRAVAFALENVAADTDVLVRLTDADGLGNREPVAVVITVVPDEPPRLALRLAGVGPAVTPQAVLPIEGTITDDHAVAAAAVRLDWGTGSRDLTIEQAAGGATAVTLDANRPVRVGLADLGLAVGSRLAVTVLARDDCGLATGPNTAVTETWTLDVVAPDTLRAALEAREVMMRRRFEAAVGDLAGARDAGPAADGADPVRQLGEAVARAAGETGEVVAGFRSIRREFEINGMLTPELDARLAGEIMTPLAAVAAGELAAAGRACREQAELPTIVAAIDAALTRMRAILDRMLEQESVNDVIEKLRGVIDAQQRIREDTLEWKRKRGREALEAP
jgi:hypothetical protein